MTHIAADLTLRLCAFSKQNAVWNDSSFFVIIAHRAAASISVSVRPPSHLRSVQSARHARINSDI